MGEIVPRWEWRTFAQRVPAADAVFDALTPVSVEESDDLYLLAPGGDNVKVRDALIDVKVLLETSPDGLECWTPVLKSPFPLDEEAVRTAFRSLRQQSPEVPPSGLTLDAFMAAAGGVREVLVRKRRARYVVARCQAERSDFEVGQLRTSSIAVESTEPADVLTAIELLGLRDYRNVDVTTGLRVLLQRVPERFGVVDVGTNSVKFRVAERAADGRAAERTVVDRAVVTRLGEGLEATGEIGAEPMARTVRAIREMAEEASALDVLAIVAVGTAGMRIARNREQVVEAVRVGSGLRLEVISGEEEGRLAYLAAAAGVGIGEGPVVVFDTGGGSSQFTFGHGPRVDDRFSVDVGAVRFTERFGLAGVVDAEVIAEARAAIGAELSRLDGRGRPDGVVAMGGAVTNLAAVKHGLTTYDPDVVQGTRLDRAEIDRQIERYRNLDADGRRTIPGLQPARAEVILAGACIVRSILDRLDCDVVTVSDRGLRHGVLLERFGSAGT